MSVCVCVCVCACVSLHKFAGQEIYRRLCRRGRRDRVGGRTPTQGPDPGPLPFVPIAAAIAMYQRCTIRNRSLVDFQKMNEFVITSWAHLILEKRPLVDCQIGNAHFYISTNAYPEPPSRAPTHSGRNLHVPAMYAL